MAEPLVVEDQVPELGTEEFNIVVEDTPQKDDATLALEAKIAEMEAERQAWQTQPQGDGGMSQLAEQLAKMNQPSAPPTDTVETIDPQALVEQVNKGFYDNPAMGVMQLLDPIVKNMQKQNESANSKRDLQISKLSVLADETTKGTYGKYQDEIETIVGSMPASETVYREAINKVQMLHMDDIVAERVEAAVAKATEAAMAQVAPVAKAPPFTNATGVQTKPPANVSANETVKSQADLTMVKNWMMAKGYTYSDDGDRNFAIGYMREKGVIK